MNRHSEIAAAVVAAINAAHIGTWTAVRKALPGSKLEDLSVAAVQVVPSTFACESADRERKKAHYGVDVGIQQAVDPDDLTAFDALLDLLPAIRALFELKRLPGLTVATWERTDSKSGAEAGYAPQHLDSMRVFTGILQFTFAVIE